ncbi:MAG: pilus assembly protein TadG-related protein [Propionicimonas sp.]
MRPRGDDGSISLMLVVLVLALFVCVGLVVDGGAKLRAVQQATQVAGEAARAATQQVDVGQVQQSGQVRLDPVAARHAAQAALTEAGVTGTVTVAAGQVRVEASVTRPTVFLGLAGLDQVTGHGSATSDLTTE